MLVPETSVNEDDLAKLREHHVGCSSQVAGVEAVTESHPVNYTADGHFRTGVRTPYAGHPFAALLLGEIIHERINPSRNSTLILFGI